MGNKRGSEAKFHADWSGRGGPQGLPVALTPEQSKEREREKEREPGKAERLLISGGRQKRKITGAVSQLPLSGSFAPIGASC